MPTRSPRRVTTSPAVRLRTLQKRMEKTAEFCRSFDNCVAYELLHEDRKCVRPEVMKQLKSYESSLEYLMDTIWANLRSLEDIRRKFNRRDPDGLCWHEPPPADLWEHLRSLGFRLA